MRAVVHRSPGSAKESGSCPIGLSAVPNGIYELRLFANDSSARLATSNPFAVGPVTLPVVTIVASDGTASENNAADTGVFTVSRTGSTTSSLTVNYSVSGTATNGVDYQTLSGSVLITAGQSSAPITVIGIDDGQAEGNETVIVTLSSNAAYSVGTPSSATVTISDDEPPLPVVTIVANDANAAEAGLDPGVFTVTRTGLTTSSLTVNYSVGGTATNGTDYQTLAGSVVIGSGQSAATITVTPIDDTSVEGNETVMVTLSVNAAYTVGTPSSATITITDDDTPPGPSLVASPETVTPGGTVTASWSGISNPSSRDWIGLYMAGADGSYWNWVYASSCTRSPGSAKESGTCAFGVPDNVPNGNYELRLFANDGFIRIATSNSFTVGPVNLPVVAIVASDSTASEGNAADTGVFTVSRTGSTTSSLTVNYIVSGTATNGTDYQTLAGSVMIGSGQNTATITVTTIDDNQAEGNETVMVTLSANAAYTVGTPSSATITITDDDTPPGPSLVASPETVAPGGTVTASWSGISNPTSRDWIGLYAFGSSGSYWNWVYASSCTQSAGSAKESGTCPFGVPGNVPNGNYELRLFANGGMSRIATSNPFIVNSLLPAVGLNAYAP